MRSAYLAVIAFFLSTSMVHAQTVVSSTPLGPVPISVTQGRFYLSPHGQHVAIDKALGSRRVISVDGVDGVDGEVFDSLAAYMAPGKMKDPLSKQAVLFSPDGNRFAYPIKRAGKDLVVVDNVTYDHGGGISFVFSPDSKRFAYLADRGKQQSPRWSVVVDGTPRHDLDDVKDLALHFSPDSKHLGYIAFAKGEWRVVVDGTPGPAYKEILNFQFDPTGDRFAYVARQTSGKNDTYWIPIVDGTAYDFPAYEIGLTSGFFTFSPEGDHWTYVTTAKSKDGYQHRLVIDGSPGEPYGSIENVRFSPDGRRIGYIANLSFGADMLKSSRKIAVVDGKQVGMEYQRLQDLEFSPDSGHVAVKATQNGANHMVVDGEESAGYLDIDDFTFSATGRYAYVGRPAKGKKQVVIDGKPDKEIQELAKGSLMFSPDGSRLLYGAHTSLQDAITYFDGKEEAIRLEVQQSPTQWKHAAAFSPDGQHVAFMAKGAGQPTLYLDWMPGAEGLQYAFPIFSDDGKHVAVPGIRPRNSTLKWSMYLNGKPVFDFDDLAVPKHLGPSTAEMRDQSPMTWQFLSNGHLQAIVIKDNQFQRVVVDPQASTLEAFARNMAQVGEPTISKPTAKLSTGSLPTGIPSTPIEALQSGAKKILDMFGNK